MRLSLAFRGVVPPFLAPLRRETCCLMIKPPELVLAEPLPPSPIPFSLFSEFSFKLFKFSLGVALPWRPLGADLMACKPSILPLPSPLASGLLICWRGVPLAPLPLPGVAPLTSEFGAKLRPKANLIWKKLHRQGHETYKVIFVSFKADVSNQGVINNVAWQFHEINEKCCTTDLSITQSPRHT